MDKKTHEFIQKSISSYGNELAPLDPQVWNYAICRWTGGHWDVLLDLSTASEPVSDLVLFLRVIEAENGYEMEAVSAHVP